MRTSVIIVNYNGWHVLETCLRSLERQSTPPGEVLIVDNGSTDGSPDLIQHRFPTYQVLPQQQNLGFAAGNNVAARVASGDVFVLVNNDTILSPDFLSEITAPFDLDPNLGSVAATMTFSRSPDVVASAGIDVFDNGLVLDRGLGCDCREFTEVQEIFGASAGAAAYRRTAFLQASGFASSFFMYLEDADLAWRLRLLGWRSVHAPRAIALHDYSASSVEGSDFKRRLLARNRIWMLARCLPPTHVRRNLLRILWYDTLVTGFAVATGDVAAVRGRIDGLRGLPRRLRERRTIQQSVRVAEEEICRFIHPSPPPSEVLRLRRLAASMVAQEDGI